MKITFVLPFAGLSGGVRVVATYARILHERGHEVTVLSRIPRPAPKGLKPALKALLGHKTPGHKTPTPLLDFLDPAHRRVGYEGPLDPRYVPDADVIVATWWKTAENIALLPPSKGQKFYLLQDYEVFPNLPADRVNATFHLPFQKIAVSSYIRSEIMTRHGLDQIEVIPNSVDLGQFNSPRRTKPPRPTVGLLYSDAQRKNATLALAALHLAKSRLPELRALVFGARRPEGPDALPGWVSFHEAPAQTDIPGIYAACDAWLFTSEKEGFGLPILEAMACRTPVLATRAGAAPDLIDGHNGTLLPATPEAFADEILRFARMPEAQWQDFSEAAHRTATAYTWEDATDRLLALFARAVGDDSAARPRDVVT